jgi:hypothetical protein
MIRSDVKVREEQFERSSRCSAIPPKVLALHREAIEPKFYHIGIMVKDFPAMLRSRAWGALDSHNQQVVFLDDFA